MIQKGVRKSFCCHIVPLWRLGETNFIDHLLCAVQYGNRERESVCVCRDIGLAKKFIQASPKMVQKNLKELFGQPNKYTPLSLTKILEQKHM